MENQEQEGQAPPHTPPPPPKQRPWLLLVLAVVIAIAVIVAVVNSSSKKDETPATKTTTSGKTSTPTSPAVDYTLTVDELCGEYEANEIVAEDKYEGKTLKLTGIVDDVGTELLGRAYIMLAGPGGGLAQCVMTNESDATSVVKGQTVTLQGRCQGKLGWPILEECVLK